MFVFEDDGIDCAALAGYSGAQGQIQGSSVAAALLEFVPMHERRLCRMTVARWEL